MQATGPFFGLVLQCGQKFSFERLQVFNLKMPFTTNQNYLWKKSRVLISVKANSLLPVGSALGNPAPKIL